MSIDFQAVKARVSIADVLAVMGWTFRTMKGEQARGKCPFHGSSGTKSRSFAVDHGDGSWFCHRCLVGGSVIDLWAKYRKITVYNAAVELAIQFIGYIPRPSQNLERGRGTVTGGPSHAAN